MLSGHRFDKPSHRTHSFYGYLVANMSSLVSSSDANVMHYYEKMDTISSYMIQRKFPNDLAYRIRRFYKHYLREKTALDERTILEELSTHLRQEVCLHLINDSVYAVHLFRGLELDELSTLICILKPLAINEADYFLRAGEMGSEMFVLVVGKLVVLSKDGSPVRILRPGDFCGELCALQIEPVRTNSVQSVTNSECFALSTADLAHAFDNNNIVERLRREAKEWASAHYQDICIEACHKEESDTESKDNSDNSTIEQRSTHTADTVGKMDPQEDRPASPNDIRYPLRRLASSVDSFQNASHQPLWQSSQTATIDNLRRSFDSPTNANLPSSWQSRQTAAIENLHEDVRCVAKNVAELAQLVATFNTPISQHAPHSATTTSTLLDPVHGERNFAGE